MTNEEILSYIYKERNHTKENVDNERMKKFLSKLNNPQDNLKFIHIAGTNGKGSVCEMINNILVNAGYTVRKVYFTTFDKV